MFFLPIIIILIVGLAFRPFGFGWHRPFHHRHRHRHGHHHHGNRHGRF